MARKVYFFDNFDLDVNTSALPIIIWGVCGGIFLGTLGSVVTRSVTGKLIRTLVRREALDKDHALTLDELGIGPKWLLRRMLKTDASLRRTVFCANEEAFPEPSVSKIRRFWHEKILGDGIATPTDFSIAKFYLPEEKRIGAELRYQEERHPVLTVAIAALGLAAAGFFVTYALPELLTMLDNFVTQVKPESKFW